MDIENAWRKRSLSPSSPPPIVRKENILSLTPSQAQFIPLIILPYSLQIAMSTSVAYCVQLKIAYLHSPGIYIPVEEIKNNSPWNLKC